jgi:uncharacterized protein YndB with AHSA1/START domain
MTRPLPPVRRQMVVSVDADLAFKIFTDEIGLWWPTDQGHSVYGAGAKAEFRDGKLIEVGPDGATADWGSVLAWEPPQRLRVTWHPGQEPDNPTEVEVTFDEVAAGQTLVTLEHSGWERLADGFEQRSGYNTGWQFVLGRFVSRADSFGGGATSPDEPVWLALQHSPGPALWPDGSPFAHPGMRDHFAFLASLQDRGVLVAAGPVGTGGDGMAVLKLRCPDEVGEYVRMAHEDDQSVVSGVLVVNARPWLVKMTG